MSAETLCGCWDWHSLFIQLFELKLKLNVVPLQEINSLFLCVLEIACVVVIKLCYDAARRRIFRGKTGEDKEKELRLEK